MKAHFTSMKNNNIVNDVSINPKSMSDKVTNLLLFRGILGLASPGRPYSVLQPLSIQIFLQF